MYLFNYFIHISSSIFISSKLVLYFLIKSYPQFVVFINSYYFQPCLKHLYQSYYNINIFFVHRCIPVNIIGHWVPKRCVRSQFFSKISPRWLNSHHDFVFLNYVWFRYPLYNLISSCSFVVNSHCFKRFNQYPFIYSSFYHT